jgi:hypothetical protein
VLTRSWAALQSRTRAPAGVPQSDDFDSSRRFAVDTVVDIMTGSAQINSTNSGETNIASP